METEIFNLYAQNKIFIDDVILWHSNLDDFEQGFSLEILAENIIQSLPRDIDCCKLHEDIDLSIKNSGLKKTFTPIVLLSKVKSVDIITTVRKISKLPVNERKKALILLIELFKTTDTRRKKEVCGENCKHPWHNL